MLAIINLAGGNGVGLIGFEDGLLTLFITPFALFMSLLVLLDTLAFTFCSLKSLGQINLSLYSVFSILGGIALPFAAGMIFFDEDVTVAKFVCFAFIAAALFFTVEKGEKKSGYIYYAGIFILNGMAGVLSKIYASADFAKITATDYSMLCAALSTVVSGVVLLFMRKDKKPMNAKAFGAICGSAFMNRIPNLLLLICLTYLPASVQYPFITGGTMIFSTIICYFTNQRPTKKELISVALSFVGVLLLVLIA